MKNDIIYRIQRRADGEWASPKTPTGGQAGTALTMDKARACIASQHSSKYSSKYSNDGYIIWKMYAGLDEREYFPPEKVYER